MEQFQNVDEKITILFEEATCVLSKRINERMKLIETARANIKKNKNNNKAKVLKKLSEDLNDLLIKDGICIINYDIDSMKEKKIKTNQQNINDSNKELALKMGRVTRAQTYKQNNTQNILSSDSEHNKRKNNTKPNNLTSSSKEQIEVKTEKNKSRQQTTKRKRSPSDNAPTQNKIKRVQKDKDENKKDLKNNNKEEIISNSKMLITKNLIVKLKPLDKDILLKYINHNKCIEEAVVKNENPEEIAVQNKSMQDVKNITLANETIEKKKATLNKDKTIMKDNINFVNKGVVNKIKQNMNITKTPVHRNTRTKNRRIFDALVEEEKNPIEESVNNNDSIFLDNVESFNPTFESTVIKGINMANIHIDDVIPCTPISKGNNVTFIDNTVQATPKICIPNNVLKEKKQLCKDGESAECLQKIREKQLLEKQKEDAEKRLQLAKEKSKKRREEAEEQKRENVKDLPIYMTEKAPLLPTYDCYDSDDPEHKIEFRFKKRQDWERGEAFLGTLKTMLMVDEEITNKLFCPAPIILDLQEIFENIDPKKLHRNSSIIWNQSKIKM